MLFLYIVDALKFSISTLLKRQGFTEKDGYKQSIMNLATDILQMNYHEVTTLLKLSIGLAKFLNNTDIRGVLLCFNGFNTTDTLQSLFNFILFFDYQQLGIEIKTATFTSFRNFRINSFGNLHELCPQLPELYLQLYSDTEFLTDIASSKGMTYNEYKKVLLLMGVTKLYEQYEIRLAMQDTFTTDELSRKLKLKGRNILETVTITTAKHLSMTPFNVMAIIHKVTLNSLKNIYRDKVFGITEEALRYFNLPISTIMRDFPYGIHLRMNLLQLFNVITQKGMLSVLS